MYADVIVDITTEKLDKIFSYRIPKSLEGRLKEGSIVKVPFGNGNRQICGYVVGFSETCGYDPGKMKEILDVEENSVAIESCLVALAAWIKEHYGGTMIQALKTVLPVKHVEQEKKQRILHRLVTKEEGELLYQTFLHKNQKARARLMALLLDQEEILYSSIPKELKITLAQVKTFEEKGIIRIDSKRVYRNPVSFTEAQEKQVEYTREQKAAIQCFCEDYRSKEYKTYLLYGVTGSGKTEVYMEMIDEVRRSGRQSIVLIPEIALTRQTVARFQKKFGDRVSIMNSRLSPGERYDQMMRARNGEVDIMIGPRSALFTPFPNLGLIIIDEEHEPAYKSEGVPRYHARETARERARLQNASVVLGSATPSLEAFHSCEQGEYKMLILPNRIGKSTLPKIYVEDMRQELKKGNYSMISVHLRDLIKDRLLKKQQIMLFINRRGYAGFLSCRSCGYVVKCPHCDVSLSTHKNGKMMCHYCGYEEPIPKRCPVCGSKHIAGFRAGTQKIEEMIKKEFPEAKVLRMDMDTTREKAGYDKVLSAFEAQEADILVGTQMIVKGHDFPNVTLVGILAADLSLYEEDYNSSERTFQLLTQAAGRAGRGEIEGEVVIQTYTPDHHSIVAAADQDYLSFYKKEMEYRELLGYPPAGHMLAVLMTSEDEKLLEQGAYYLKEYATRIAKKEVVVIGPGCPYVGKVKDFYRRIIYLKHDSYEVLIKMKDAMEKYIEVNKGFHNIRIQFDFDPVRIF